MSIKGLISASQLSRGDIEKYIKVASRFAKRNLPIKAKNDPPIISLFFFEESTRTRVGFIAAAYRLGMEVINVTEAKFHERMGRAESLEDTIRSIQSYCDLICMRHPDPEVFNSLDLILEKPVINCGNGDGEHPTQALIDLYTIYKEFNRLDNLKIAFIGNPRYSRSAHSLIIALSKFKNIEIRTISPKELYFSNEQRKAYLDSGNILEETTEMHAGDMDVIYVTGFPAILPIKTFSQKMQARYWITPEVVKTFKKGAVVLCPLPRIDEIDPAVDGDSMAKYFSESKNGLYMRMAILNKFL